MPSFMKGNNLRKGLPAYGAITHLFHHLFRAVPAKAHVVARLHHRNCCLRHADNALLILPFPTVNVLNSIHLITLLEFLNHIFPVLGLPDEGKAVL